MGLHALLRGIFLTQGSNPHLLHWQVDSLTTVPPGRPLRVICMFVLKYTDAILFFKVNEDMDMQKWPKS